MKRAASIYIGALLLVVISFYGFVRIPHNQLAVLQPVVDTDGNPHPARPEGAVLAGRREYISLGCIYCHSQQVRPQGFGADIERAWGMRRTVARDHIYDTPPLLGTMRTGPDLVNIGARQPSDAWHYLHLYDPVLTSPGSTMPPHAFLFDLERTELEQPRDALKFPVGGPPRGFAIVPGERVKNLVAYLKSLDHSYATVEAP